MKDGNIVPGRFFEIATTNKLSVNGINLHQSKS